MNSSKHSLETKNSDDEGIYGMFNLIVSLLLSCILFEQ